MRSYTALFLLLVLPAFSYSQVDSRLYEIIENVSSERLKNDVTTLTKFGTRHTLSDTVSTTRGIGAESRHDSIGSI